jgi:hypothetical protein
VAGFDVTAVRTVSITLDGAGSLQGLIDQLVAIAARPATDGASLVQRIDGRGAAFTLTLTKPD